VAAGEEVLGGHLDLEVAVGVGADPVRHGGGGGHGPAGPAAALVSDFADGGTLRPIFTSVKGFWEVLKAEQCLSGASRLLGRKSVGDFVGVDSHEGAEVAVADGRVEVASGCPGGVGGIDVVDEVAFVDIVVGDGYTVDTDWS